MTPNNRPRVPSFSFFSRVKAKGGRAQGNVRFTPESGHVQCTSSCLLWANSGLMRCNKEDRYSINSLARASTAGGIVRPSALAVLRLITNSNLVGACTGMSAGFSPLRIRSA